MCGTRKEEIVYMLVLDTKSGTYYHSLLICHAAWILQSSAASNFYPLLQTFRVVDSIVKQVESLGKPGR